MIYIHTHLEYIYKIKNSLILFKTKTYIQFCHIDYEIEENNINYN
jgi:hypothetical protein